MKENNSQIWFDQVRASSEKYINWVNACARKIVDIPVGERYVSQPRETETTKKRKLIDTL